jgi:hypothetical protein
MWPGDFGGNIDAPEVREGTTLYLPILTTAPTYFGDGTRVRARVNGGTGLETSMDVEPGSTSSREDHRLAVPSRTRTTSWSREARPLIDASGWPT